MELLYFGWNNKKMREENHIKKKNSKTCLIGIKRTGDYNLHPNINLFTNKLSQLFRDIIALNPLYRDSLQQMLQFGQRVVDNPVYLRYVVPSCVFFPHFQLSFVP